VRRNVYWNISVPKNQRRSWL